MKTAEEILAPHVETPFRHTQIVEKDNAIAAMRQFFEQVIPPGSGLELIAKERMEQIVKHGFDKEHDGNDKHQNGELADAAHFALTLHGWPEEWDREFADKIAKKPYKERLAIAGALIASEIDRLNSL